MNPKQALVLLPPAGFEEIEAVTVMDVLRRGGVGVFAAAAGGSRRVSGSHGIEIGATHAFSRPWGFPYDAVVLPGGMPGTELLAADADVLAELREAAGRGRVVAAVCAAPLVLDAAGLLAGRRYCCYPGIEKRISSAATFVPGVPTVADGNLVTGTGPGTAALFALEVLRALGGPADEVAAAMLVR